MSASHYVKMMLDMIFGMDNFINEIIWHYRTGGVGKRWFAQKHDTIFLYGKTNKYTFNLLEKKEYYKDLYGENKKPGFPDRKSGEDANGFFRIVYENDVWVIKSVFNMSKEYLGYPTQKPEALLEKIILASTN